MKLIFLQEIPGYQPPLKFPSIKMVLSVDSHSNEPIDTQRAKTLDAALPGYTDRILESTQPLPEKINSVLKALLTILERSSKPTLPYSYVHSIEGVDERELTIYLPCIQGLIRPIAQSLKVLISFIGGDDQDVDFVNWVTTIITTLAVLAPKGKNNARMINYAWREGIPCQPFLVNSYQFGWGAQSRVLNSSITDETPSWAVHFARDKTLSLALIRKAGLPVARQFKVSRREDIEKVMSHLSYPVVLKPADKDGGKGVFAGIRSIESLYQAFDEGRKVSKNLLVEEFIVGDDYRLQVYKGEVFRLIKRTPAEVKGDGISTVQELIEARNALSKSGGKTLAGSNINPIVIDLEVREWVSAAGLALSSIPKNGELIRLRGAANLSSGGSSSYPDRVHPDNLFLASKVTRLFRLDLAGIDLLIPDISQSWLKQKCAICEVNAQPQVAEPHIPFLMERLVENKGRIPTVFVLGKDSSREWYLCFRELWEQRKASRCLGVVSKGGVWVGEYCVALSSTDLYSSTCALLSDKQVNCALVFISDLSEMPQGLPVDRADLVILDSTIDVNSLNALRNKPMEFSSRYLTVREKVSQIDTTIELLSPSDLAEELIDLFCTC